jgi:hypothetical protein
MRLSILLAPLGLVMVLLAASTQARPATPKLSVQDYLEIEQLYARFNHALDTRRPDEFVTVWTNDGEFVGGRGPGRGNESRTPIKGRAALHRMAEGPGIGGRHFVSNLVLTPGPGMVKASAYLLLLDARFSPPRIAETAIYDDTIVKVASEWRFKRRVNWRDDDDISPFRPPRPPSILERR